MNVTCEKDHEYPGQYPRVGSGWSLPQQVTSDMSTYSEGHENQAMVPREGRCAREGFTAPQGISQGSFWQMRTNEVPAFFSQISSSGLISN